MFKQRLIIIVLLAFANPLWAGLGHDHINHHGNHGPSEPQLVITPIVPKVLKKGAVNEVVLYVQNKQAQTVDIEQFEVVHTQPVHLLISEPSLEHYHHEHPTQIVAGQYAFGFTPQTACTYRIWADVKLKGSYQHYIPVDLAGTGDCQRTLNPTARFEAQSQGYDFKLTLDGEPRVGAAVMATISISRNGESANILEPVMGAFAHLVGFYEDYQSVAHIHPLGEEPTQADERGGPSLRFHIAPEQAGYLKLFAQVQINGEQVFAPFGLTVDEVDPNAAKASHAVMHKH